MSLETPVQHAIAVAKILVLKTSLSHALPAHLEMSLEVMTEARAELHELMENMQADVNDYENRIKQGDPSRLAGK